MSASAPTSGRPARPLRSHFYYRGLAARQNTPAIDGVVYGPIGALYQLQPSFHTSSTEPEPRARARRAGKAIQSRGHLASRSSLGPPGRPQTPLRAGSTMAESRPGPRSAASHISMCEAAALGATPRSSELAVAPPGRLGTRPRTASSPLTESRPRGRGRQATLHRPLQYPGESRLLS